MTYYVLSETLTPYTLTHLLGRCHQLALGHETLLLANNTATDNPVQCLQVRSKIISRSDSVNIMMLEVIDSSRDCRITETTDVHEQLSGTLCQVSSMPD